MSDPPQTESDPLKTEAEEKKQVVTIPKRFVAGFVIFLGTLGLVFSVAGIFTIWWINAPLTDSLTEMLDQAAEVLVFSQARLDKMDSNLAEVQGFLAVVEQAAIQSGQELVEADGSIALQLIAETVGAQLAPTVEATAEVIKTIRGTITSVNATLTSANRIPFVSVPTLPMERLAEIDRQMQTLVEDTQSLVETVKVIEVNSIDRISSEVIEQTESLDSLVEGVRTPIDNFNERLDNIEERLNNTAERLARLIDWATILLTLLFLWFGLAQAALGYLGWYIWKSGNIPVLPESAAREVSELK
jgi:hypothetical protein